MDCEVQVDDGLASRRHARMYVADEGLMVEDLGSRNGVFVNQQRLRAPTLLAHGDVVGIGRESFEVVDMMVVPRRQKPTIPAPFGADADGPDLVTATPMLGVLTEREREVFELIVVGHTQSEIATQLRVSVKTVESHRAHIADKLKCRTRAELVAYALTAGILSRPKR
jgi:DNA-binding CsgD family transcriptional regulator